MKINNYILKERSNNHLCLTDLFMYLYSNVLTEWELHRKNIPSPPCSGMSICSFSFCFISSSAFKKKFPCWVLRLTDARMSEQLFFDHCHRHSEMTIASKKLSCTNALWQQASAAEGILLLLNATSRHLCTTKSQCWGGRVFRRL